MTHVTRGWFVFWLVTVSLLLGGSARWASGMGAVPYTRFAVCQAGPSVPVTARLHCLATGQLPAAYPGCGSPTGGLVCRLRPADAWRLG